MNEYGNGSTVKSLSTRSVATGKKKWRRSIELAVTGGSVTLY